MNLGTRSIEKKQPSNEKSRVSFLTVFLNSLFLNAHMYLGCVMEFKDLPEKYV
jgi:hypothetical protein